MNDHNKAFAIYINNNDSIEDIERIRNFNITQSSYSDIFVCSDDNVVITNSFSLLPSFYLKFFQGSIIFTNIENYMEYKDVAKLAKSYIIVKSAQEMVDNSINKHNLKDAMLLTITDGEIHEI